MNNTHGISSCRSCNSKGLQSVINLGEMALTGVFIKPEEADPLVAPINLVFCNNCKFLQVLEEVDPDLMYDSYWYRSGTNQTMNDHLKGVVEDVIHRTQLGSKDLVLDIGCNDGTLLKYYSEDINKVGCDPSDAILDISDERIIKINDYFSAKRVLQENISNQIKVITSISMFYDLSNPKQFVRDIHELLSDDGIWILEMNYTANMVTDLGYDMISHEHVGYYTLISFINVLENTNIFVNDISFNSINGGSIRIICSKNNFQTNLVKDTINKETLLGLDKPETYVSLMQKINKHSNNLHAWLSKKVEAGNKIALYGASTRCNTILQFGNIDKNIIYAASERNPQKYGLETSRTRIPIRSEKEIRNDNPEYFFIGPYYFLDEFIDREIDYLKNGGEFIVPLPIPSIFSYQDGEIIKEAITA